MEPTVGAKRPVHHQGRSASQGRWCVVIGLVGTLTLASCGGGDSRGLSEGQLVARANALCTQHTQEITAAAQSRFPTLDIPAAAALIDFAEQKVVPEAEKLVDQLESLSAPEDVEQDFHEYLIRANTAVGRMKVAPSMVFSEINAHDAFGDANEVAEDLGLTACARASEQWSNAPFLSTAGVAGSSPREGAAGSSSGAGAVGPSPEHGATGPSPAAPLARPG
jgi:hypothetical protein